LASAVHLSWFGGVDRSRVVDQDREKIDEMVLDLREKAMREHFDNSNQGLRTAMREFWLLGQNIEHCQLK
jgi:hypothetical protein